MNTTVWEPGTKGLLASRDCPAQLAIYRHVIDPATKAKTGCVKLDRMRLASEVYRDLCKHLDVMHCDKCGHERRRKGHSDYCAKHAGCGGEYESLIDEYFSGPSVPREDFDIPSDFRRVCCFPVTGGNEGHYWHVGVLVPDPSGRGPLLFREIALGKTFKGWEHCCLMAARCSKLMGA